MKRTFLLLSSLFAITASGQITSFDPIRFSENGIITTSFDTIPIKTLEMLVKESLSYNSVKVTFPSSYSWTADVRRRESFEKMASEIRFRDANGRELIPDVDKINTARLINKYFP